MHARVEESDRPDWREEGEDEVPPCWPCTLVVHVPKDPSACVERLPASHFADGQSDDCSDDDGNVDEDAECLDARHDRPGVDADDGVD